MDGEPNVIDVNDPIEFPIVEGAISYIAAITNVPYKNILATLQIPEGTNKITVKETPSLNNNGPFEFEINGSVDKQEWGPKVIRFIKESHFSTYKVSRLDKANLDLKDQIMLHVIHFSKETSTHHGIAILKYEVVDIANGSVKLRNLDNEQEIVCPIEGIYTGAPFALPDLADDCAINAITFRKHAEYRPELVTAMHPESAIELIPTEFSKELIAIRRKTEARNINVKSLTNIKNINLEFGDYFEVKSGDNSFLFEVLGSNEDVIRARIIFGPQYGSRDFLIRKSFTIGGNMSYYPVGNDWAVVLENISQIIVYTIQSPTNV